MASAWRSLPAATARSRVRLIYLLRIGWSERERKRAWEKPAEWLSAKLHDFGVFDFFAKVRKCPKNSKLLEFRSGKHAKQLQSLSHFIRPFNKIRISLGILLLRVTASPATWT